jgi:hypothetical protein
MSHVLNSMGLLLVGVVEPLRRKEVSASSAATVPRYIWHRYHETPRAYHGSEYSRSQPNYSISITFHIFA